MTEEAVIGFGGAGVGICADVSARSRRARPLSGCTRLSARRHAAARWCRRTQLASSRSATPARRIHDGPRNIEFSLARLDRQALVDCNRTLSECRRLTPATAARLGARARRACPSPASLPRRRGNSIASRDRIVTSRTRWVSMPRCDRCGREKATAHAARSRRTRDRERRRNPAGRPRDRLAGAICAPNPHCFEFANASTSADV